MTLGEARSELIAQPAIPYAEGQRLGSQGAPIPQEVADGYIAYLDLLRGFAALSAGEIEAFHRASTRASSRSESERGFAKTDMEKALDAAMTIAGYVGKGGLPDYLKGIGVDGRSRMSIEEMGTLSPELVAASADGIRAYMAGRSFRKPRNLQDGIEFVGNVCVVDAYTLGFVVRAATLGVRVGRAEVPVDEETWEAFSLGKSYLGDKTARAHHVNVLCTEIEQAKGIVTAKQRKRIGDAFDLGGRIGVAEDLERHKADSSAFAFEDGETRSVFDPDRTAKLDRQFADTAGLSAARTMLVRDGYLAIGDEIISADLPAAELESQLRRFVGLRRQEAIARRQGASSENHRLQ